ncbi:MAG: SDR family oxidoreductase [Pseudohongiella sp.]|nr:SDR family oxidoreductase [Pseudohongiella sp.]MDO9519063.1 SDR family oxidoreductase [Pseudohongiella sp.]MDP2129068.1 SDR family oxidoreductase [Pseudohongiella sp.]
MTQKKVALVTGAASGIGRACAISLARSGYQIAANYRSREAETLELLTELGPGEHKAFRADVTNAAQAEVMVGQVARHYGRIDVLVNAAGQFIRQDISAGDFGQWQQDWSQCLHLNLTAPMNLAFLVSKVMIQQQSGKIVNITSRGAFRGEPNAPAYGAAKSGLNSASQSLALALGSQGIHVYAVAPGWTETPTASPRIRAAGWEDVAAQSPLGRIGQPSEIGDLVAYLCSDNTAYLTGAIIDANGASYLRN